MPSVSHLIHRIPISAQIRLFGDPRDNRGQETPTLRINVVVSPEEKFKAVVRQDSHDVICDFVDGIAFGDAVAES